MSAKRQAEGPEKSSALARTHSDGSTGRGEMLSAVDRLQSFLRIVDKRESEVRAWAHIDSNHALDQARYLDESKPKSMLNGLPIAIKDIIATKDMPTEYGSPIYSGNQPLFDAQVVRLLRVAGAIILGKTVTTEFAGGVAGPTTNPFDASRTPGGSSSGSAAAVGAGMAPVALGTQTAGSVVRPASYCGVYGLKPSYDAISVDGVSPLSPSQDTVGIIARQVADLRLVFAAVSGGWLGNSPPPKDVSAMRVGFYCDDYLESLLEESAVRQMQRLRASLDETDWAVTDFELPQIEDRAAARLLDEAAVQVARHEVAKSLGHLELRKDEGLSQAMLDKFQFGRSIDEGTYFNALKLRDVYLEVMDREVWSHIDFLVTPSTSGVPPKGLAHTGDRTLCRLWTLLGVPALAVPGLTESNSGLPLGVQIVGPRGSDAALIDAGEWLQKHLGTLA